MLVTIIGSGNVATVLGRVFVNKGYTVDKVYSRNIQHAAVLANELGAVATDDLHTLDDTSDLYLIAVTDSSIAAIASALSFKNKLVVHTAGSVSKEILSNTSERYGVLWPMKMVRKQMTTLQPVTMVVDGSSEEVITEIEKLAHLFTDTVIRADDAKRAQMHMVAAFTANFANHLYHMAADFCVKEQIDFSVFYPIILETAYRLQDGHPRDLQAGPAFRGDQKTMEAHAAMLSAYPEMARIYDMMSKSIGHIFEK